MALVKIVLLEGDDTPVLYNMAKVKDFEKATEASVRRRLELREQDRVIVKVTNKPMDLEEVSV